ncbi:uncharacterized protein LOC126690137 [Quercus robur]|uniref:uncharacterized protein LOC126690137 n=1 Tax=Quercus robur TaxID=38942 RepID=UPI0021637217|nr:uncharacterized protein LOC126690137 [Quercus robur]
MVGDIVVEKQVEAKSSYGEDDGYWPWMLIIEEDDISDQKVEARSIMSNSFEAFDKEKLIRLAKFYPSDFPGTDILALGPQFQNYIFDMRNNDLFLELQRVGELAEKLVKTGKYDTYPLVYLLIKLVSTLSEVFQQ